MKITIENQPVYKLELSLNEVKWLKGAMQNPLHGEHPDEEDIDNRYFRELFFETLQELLDEKKPLLTPGDLMERLL